MHRLALLALCLGALPLTGCVAVAAGGAAYGAYKMSRNDVERDFPADLEATWQAAIASLQENGHPVSSQATHGPTSGVLTISDVEVKVATHAQGFTRVQVRVGTFETADHRRRADLILTGIARRLGSPTP